VGADLNLFPLADLNQLKQLVETSQRSAGTDESARERITRLHCQVEERTAEEV
jgi:hypothetical protein